LITPLNAPGGGSSQANRRPRAIEPEQTSGMTQAEPSNAAMSAVEFSAITRLQMRRWMMRLFVGSLAALLVLAATAMAEEAVTEQDANAVARAKLAQPASIELDKIPLQEALEKLAEATGVQTYLDIRAVVEANLVPPAEVTISLKDVPGDMLMRLTLDQHELVYTLEEGVAIATTQEKLDEELEIRVYEINDLVELAAKSGAPSQGVPGAVPVPPNYIMELIDVITGTVDPMSWENMGGPATIGQYRGTLVVSQNAGAHKEVAELLDGLRAAMAE
jgi:hypothetical protein